MFYALILMVTLPHELQARLASALSAWSAT